MKNNKTILFLILVVFLLIIGIVQATIYSFTPTSPQNNTYTTNTQPDFTFTAISDINTTFSCELFINSAGFGVNSSVSNNTATTITANATLSQGQKTWNINCTDANGTVSSTPYILTVDTTNPAVFAASTNTTLVKSSTPITAQANVTDTNLNASTIEVNSVALSSGGGDLYTVDTNASALGCSEGSCTLTFNATDYAGNYNDTTTTSITVDDTPPTVTPRTTVYPGTQTAAKDGDTVVLNATVTDTNGVNTVTVDASALGCSGTLAMGKNGASDNYNASCILSGATNGTNSLTVTAVDNATNTNNTESLSVTVDNTNPSITLNSPSNGSSLSSSSVTFNWTVTDNQDTSLSCDLYLNGAQNTTGIASANATPKTQALTLSDATYNWSVNCSDNAANTVASATRTFTVSTGGGSNNNGGSSGSSGGGSGSRVVAGEIATFVESYVPIGNNRTFEIENGEIGFSKIRFVAKNKLFNVVMKVKKTEASDINNPFTGTVYKYVEVEKWNLDQEDIESPQITFPVSRSWLSENNINQDDIALFRYVNSQWVELETSVSSEDTDYIYFTAATPGFSYFAIGTTAEPQPAAEETQQPAEETVEQPPAEPTAPSEETPPQKDRTSWWFLLLGLIIIAGIVGYLYWSKKK